MPTEQHSINTEPCPGYLFAINLFRARSFHSVKKKAHHRRPLISKKTKWNGTYVYIEQSSNQELQSSTYSPRKHRHLVKFMMVTAPDGNIIDAPGPFLADAANSDAKILSNLLKKEGDGIAAFFRKNDHLILDRGFRDVLALLEKLGIQ
ncbi:unnamed protein product [Orchesella dallaii]|uniref:DDE Tnp4 domain-containing protein n=1 Tax=Orchesella dallaii TaxID=48710 RepID=A0ABP1RRG7_9HEXA